MSQDGWSAGIGVALMFRVDLEAMATSAAQLNVTGPRELVHGVRSVSAVLVGSGDYRLLLLVEKAICLGSCQQVSLKASGER
jgi:hypothetical protein